MRRIAIAALCGWVAIAMADGTDAAAAQTAESVQSLQQQVRRSSVEVKTLQHEVDRQEADDRQAEQRMSERDERIAELQRQLEALHAPAQAASAREPATGQK